MSPVTASPPVTTLLDNTVFNHSIMSSSSHHKRSLPEYSEDDQSSSAFKGTSNNPEFGFKVLVEGDSPTIE
jgi:hypothetical protein